MCEVLDIPLYASDLADHPRKNAMVSLPARA